jgi:hypothetical protein
VKIAIIAAVCMAAAAPATSRANTGYDLYADCTSGTIYARGFCLGYIAGIYAVADDVCGPGTSVQRGQLEMIFLDWARRRPANLSLSQVEAVHAALREAYPCR